MFFTVFYEMLFCVFLFLNVVNRVSRVWVDHTCSRGLGGPGEVPEFWTGVGGLGFGAQRGGVGGYGPKSSPVTLTGEPQNSFFAGKFQEDNFKKNSLAAFGSWVFFWREAKIFDRRGGGGCTHRLSQRGDHVWSRPIPNYIWHLSFFHFRPILDCSIDGRT